MWKYIHIKSWDRCFHHCRYVTASQRDSFCQWSVQLYHDRLDGGQHLPRPTHRNLRFCHSFEVWSMNIIEIPFGITTLGGIPPIYSIKHGFWRTYPWELYRIKNDSLNIYDDIGMIGMGDDGAWWEWVWVLTHQNEANDKQKSSSWNMSKQNRGQPPEPNILLPQRAETSINIDQHCPPVGTWSPHLVLYGIAGLSNAREPRKHSHRCASDGIGKNALLIDKSYMQQFVCIVQQTIIQTKGMYCILLILLWNKCMKGMYCILLWNICFTNHKNIYSSGLGFCSVWNILELLGCYALYLKECKIPQQPQHTPETTFFSKT